MNETTAREAQLRKIKRRIASARRQAAQQIGERDTATRQYGAAHPRSIRVSRRLTSTQSAHRQLLRMYRFTAGELERMKRHRYSA